MEQFFTTAVQSYEETTCKLQTKCKQLEKIRQDYHTNELLDIINSLKEDLEEKLNQAKYHLMKSNTSKIDLVRLSDHGPAFETLLYYLPWTDRKNLRLVSKDVCRIVTEFDKSFRKLLYSFDILIC